MIKIDELTRQAVKNLKDFKSGKTCVIAYPGYSVLFYNGHTILEYFPYSNEPCVKLCVPNARNRIAILNRINAVLDDFDMWITRATLTVWQLKHSLNSPIPYKKDLGSLKLGKLHFINLKTKELK